jgi:hypothetical protein
MGTLWSSSGQVAFDNNGIVAPGAIANFFEAGTTTPKSVYQDAAEGTPHETDVAAGGNGRWPAVFIPFGSFDVRVSTSGGTELFFYEEVPNPEPFSEDFTLDETTIFQTGMIAKTLLNASLTGFVRLNGRTIGSAASSATERANADTADLFTYLWNGLSNTAAAVSGGRGLTAAADFAANKRLTLPDWRAATVVGFDDMGNTAASLLGSAPVVLGSTILAGSILGANTHTLLTAEAPSHTHAISITSAAGSAHTHSVSGNTAAEAAHTHTGATNSQSANHSHSYNTAPNKVGTATGGFATVGGTIWNGADTSATSGTDSGQAHTHTFTTDAGSSHLHSISLTSGSESSHTHLVSGTSASTGSDGAHNNLSRAGLVTWHVKL